jgi:aminoglycoside phosphotransferase (APT) family kinase protein
VTVSTTEHEAAPAAIELPVGNVTQWLRAQVGELDEPLDWALITGGRSNLTYRLTDASGRRWVLRRPPLAGVVKSAHDVLREFRIMAALRGSAVPVPVMVGSCDEPGVIGAPFFVMENVDGFVLLNQDLAEEHLPESARGPFGDDLVAVLARLHAIAPASVGLADLGRGDAYVARQLTRWQTQLERLDVDQSPLMRSVLERLQSGVPEQRRTTIVHGDFRPGNVIADSAGRIHAVLDWELCTIGDPLADLGWLVAYWATDIDDPLPFPVPTRATGFRPRVEIARRYGELSGEPLEDIEFYVAFALWRLAAIVAGVNARTEKGAYEGAPVAAGGVEPHERVHRLVEAAHAAAVAAGR